MRTLIDPVIGCQGDDKDIAVTLGFLEMAQMADVHEIEDAVAMHDLLALAAQIGEDDRQLVEILDLALSRNGGACGLRFQGLLLRRTDTNGKSYSHFSRGR